MVDQKTIRQLKAKNEKAFEYVYHETKRGVYSIIFSIVKDHAETQDLMQDVYMKMMKSIDQFQENTNFNNWLLQMAKYHTIDYYRRSKKFVPLDETDYDNLLAAQEESPDEKEHFERMISILDDDQRMIVLLKIVDQMKFKDIAKVVDKPLGTVLWIYQEALKVLKGYEG